MIEHTIGTLYYLIINIFGRFYRMGIIIYQY